MMMPLEKCFTVLEVLHQAGGDEQHVCLAERAIDEYMKTAGINYPARKAAVASLRAEYNRRFAGSRDSTLMRDYIEKLERDLRYEAEDMQ